MRPTRTAWQNFCSKSSGEGKKARSIDRISASIWCLKTGAAASRRPAVRVRSGHSRLARDISHTFAARNKPFPAHIRIFIEPEKNNKRPSSGGTRIGKNPRAIESLAGANNSFSVRGTFSQPPREFARRYILQSPRMQNDANNLQTQGNDVQRLEETFSFSRLTCGKGNRRETRQWRIEIFSDPERSLKLTWCKKEWSKKAR